MIPFDNPKPYSPNLWCENSNQGMTVGKCYCGYASITLNHEKGPIGPPKWDGFYMDLKPSFSCQLEDRFSASMWKA